MHALGQDDRYLFSNFRVKLSMDLRDGDSQESNKINNVDHTLIGMKVGSKLPYEALQIKFDFRHDYPTFP